MKKIFVIVGINLLLGAGQLGLAVGRSADGVQVSGLNQQWQAVKHENELLSEQVYAKSSLVYIASQSANLGLASSTVKFVGGVNVAAVQLAR
ncbi:MAG: hypothetical protein Q7S31_00335 [bacterium]|nr:hypothetical protein [bacterium]